MSAAVPLPQKQDVPKEIWRIATTLSDDAQNAALRKAREMGFDLNKGRITLEETLINVSKGRDVLLDAVEKSKIPQLPLKLQFILLTQAQAAANCLSDLGAGKDTVVALEDSVDELTSTIWQYNLQNLSGEVLGFQQKMNQLKAEETLIRQVHRDAELFEKKNKRADEILVALDTLRAASSERAEIVNTNTERVQQLLGTATKAASDSTQASETAQRQAELIAKTLSEAGQNQEAAKLAAVVCNQLQGEIQEKAASLENLQVRFGSAVEKLDSDATAALKDFGASRDDMIKLSTEELAALKSGMEQQLAELRSQCVSKLESNNKDQTRSISELKTSLDNLLESTSEHIALETTSLSQTLADELKSFQTRSDETLGISIADFKKRTDECALNANAVVERNDAELKRLTGALDELEGRIRVSIERATGYSLFHSFQTRQLGVERSKKFWAWALGGALLASIVGAIFLIFELRSVQTYNVAFFLRLGLSIPLIYAVAFCSVQYSRERRLEEEYAFKSNISISLEPYQKLVEKLVKKDNPEELAKYTQFIIDSVNKVFASPTEHIFDEHGTEKDSAEGLIKVLTDFVKTIVQHK
jgi:hypothetical protein